MRGTCSSGFTLQASTPDIQVFEDPYQLINARTVAADGASHAERSLPGVAAGAVERARLFVRGVAQCVGPICRQALHTFDHVRARPWGHSGYDRIGKWRDTKLRFLASDRLDALDFQSG